MRILITAILFLLANVLKAQSFVSTVNNGTAYIVYMTDNTVAASGVASIFGVNISALSQVNSFSANDVLQKGTQVKVPVAGLLSSACSSVDTCFAVYYTASQSEGLYRIGKNHGDIKVAQIRQLNHLRSDKLSNGQQLLIGYIAMHNGATMANANVADVTNDAKPILHAAETVVADTTPLPAAIHDNMPVKPGAAKKIIADSALLTYKGEGYFMPMFTDHGIDSVRTTATFKSESGWADGKYYVLADNVDAGTVLKITNLQTSKTIYARVVGNVPHVKRSNDIHLRISSAGMIALGFYYDDKYPVTIHY